MATSTMHRLGLRTARRGACAFSSPVQSAAGRTIARRRPFSSSAPRPRKDEDDDGAVEPEDRNNFTAPRRSPPSAVDADSLAPSDRALYDSLSTEEKARYLATGEELRAHLASPAVERRLSSAIADAVHRVNLHEPPPEKKPERSKHRGFFAEGEEDPEGVGPDEEFREDDISSLAHRELEQHREMREYARLAAWEMPLLSKLAKPFQPPQKDQILRFRYTTYMGEEHPAAKKVVVQFSPADLPDLTAPQREKLIKLVGPRYNPETAVVRMSCEMFEAQAQNKRYLGDLVDTLLAEARDPTDTFADLPLDFRHHTPKHPPEGKPTFPREWRMTPARRAHLDALRADREARDQQLATRGRLVDGVKVIQAAIEAGRMQELERRPALDELVAQRLGKGKGGAGRKAMRRS